MLGESNLDRSMAWRRG